MLNKIRTVLFAVALFSGSQLWAQEYTPQAEIDSAYLKIMETDLGQAICRQILGGEAEAVQHHLGVSQDTAQQIAANCPRSARHAWIYATRPSDIRKLTLGGSSARKYKVFVSEVTFPIESWTEPFSNTTVVVTPSLPISSGRWVRILAHETAVYFDSKSNPAHPDAGHIPSLRQLNIHSGGVLDPLVTLSNPMQSHAFTFVRALQVEHEILRQLNDVKIESEFLPLVSGQCAHECLKSMMLKIRTALLPIGLPLLAYAPHYRSLILQELPGLRLDWSEAVWQRAKQALNHLPLEFIRTHSNGNAVGDMYRVFFSESQNQSGFSDVTRFLELDLWPLEKESLFSATVVNGPTLIEFMKVPTLSGYNVGLSSGPRVRIRGGNVE